MCGRYTLIKLSDFTDMFPWIRPLAPDESAPPPPPPPRYNIAPTQPIAVVANDGNNKIDYFHWGLIPSWSKDASIGWKLINARAESLASKPAFRAALKRRRCLIPASGFYEWKKSPDGKSKSPMYIRRRDQKPFAFAGLWEVWRSADGSELPSCTIITGPPNELVETIHDRMPVILRPELYQQWLGTGELPPERAGEFFTPYPAQEMEAIPVSRAVNNASFDSPECIEAITDPPAAESSSTPARSTRKRPGEPEQPTLF